MVLISFFQNDLVYVVSARKGHVLKKLFELAKTIIVEREFENLATCPLLPNDISLGYFSHRFLGYYLDYI